MRGGACVNYSLALKVKVKLSLIRAFTGFEGSRRLRFPEFLDIRHMKVVRFLALLTGRLYPQKISLVFIYVIGRVDLN
jgi:hypothetical protein